MQTDTSVIKLDINLIIPNKYQPRKVFDDKALESLSESIKTYGIINPILVRKKDDKYEIIAGERRFRAAKKIGLTEVPVIIKNASEQQMAELALIENLERLGLSPIEEAKSYEEIMRIGNQTQESLAKKLGKNQSTIANKIRLLSLPEEIQDALANKKISERHARSLISIESKERQLELLNRIINEKLTVKETEQIIKEKEITEDEIKQAINDIMKSLNITEEENKKEEKEDDNMNNGNFFPNFDNNNVANNNASLNMMNMQSMNQAPMAPTPEMVVPTVEQPSPVPQFVGSTLPNDNKTPMVNPEPPMMSMNTMPSFDQFGPNPMVAPEMNLNTNAMDNFVAPPNMNDASMFGLPQMPNNSALDMPSMNSPMVDVPLFNQEVVMPTKQGIMPEMAPPVEPAAPTLVPPTTEVPLIANNQFEVPVIAAHQEEINKVTQLQDFLNSNGYAYKLYSNETDNCIIIEMPKN